MKFFNWNFKCGMNKNPEKFFSQINRILDNET